jgi:hypothetical protein
MGGTERLSERLSAAATRAVGDIILRGNGGGAPIVRPGPTVPLSAYLDKLKLISPIQAIAQFRQDVANHVLPGDADDHSLAAFLVARRLQKQAAISANANYPTPQPVSDGLVWLRTHFALDISGGGGGGPRRKRGGGGGLSAAARAPSGGAWDPRQIGGRIADMLGQGDGDRDIPLGDGDGDFDPDAGIYALQDQVRARAPCSLARTLAARGSKEALRRLQIEGPGDHLEVRGRSMGLDGDDGYVEGPRAAAEGTAADVEISWDRSEEGRAQMEQLDSLLAERVIGQEAAVRWACGRCRVALTVMILV